MPPMRTVLLPMKRPVRPPPPPPLAEGVGGGAEELDTRPGETLPPFVVLVPAGVWLVGPGVLLPCAVGMAAELLDVPGTEVPPSLVTAVPAVVLDDEATACRPGVPVPTTAATTPTTATTATAAQILRCARGGWAKDMSVLSFGRCL